MSVTASLTDVQTKPPENTTPPVLVLKLCMTILQLSNVKVAYSVPTQVCTKATVSRSAVQASTVNCFLSPKNGVCDKTDCLNVNVLVRKVA